MNEPTPEMLHSCMNPSGCVVCLERELATTKELLEDAIMRVAEWQQHGLREGNWRVNAERELADERKQSETYRQETHRWSQAHRAVEAGELKRLAERFNCAPENAATAALAFATTADGVLDNLRAELAAEREAREKAEVKMAECLLLLQSERKALVDYLIPWRAHIGQSWLKHFEESGGVYFDSLGYVKAKPLPVEPPELQQRAEQAEAKLNIAREALDFVINREHLMFAECSDAEEILKRCRDARDKIT